MNVKQKQKAEEAQSGITNDNRCNRWLTLATVKILRHFRPKIGNVLLLTNTICVKYGTLRSLAEASTMKFIAQKTSIPVPKIYCAFKHKSCVYLVMERVKGEAIGRTWSSKSESSKTFILHQLKEMIDEMRRLVPPSLHVSNVDGGQLWDCRIPGLNLEFGPFLTIDAFHRFLRGGLVEPSTTLPSEINDLIKFHAERDWLSPVFTHGDLSSLNIIIDGDVITGIVDWETAGWYPYYWEYTTASQVNFRNLFWGSEIDKFLEPYTIERQMEEIRQRFFGDV